MLKQAVILAGGFGTRLGNHTKATPKPLLPVGGKPLLEHLVWNLARHGIRDVVMSVGYLASRIQQHFGDGAQHGVRITYVVEEEPMGTAGAVALCAPYLQERFLLLNGDTLFDLNFLDLDLLARHTQAMACVALRQVPDASRYGAVSLDGERIADFAEKAAPGPGPVSGGVTVFDRRVLEWIPQGPSSLERDVMPRLVSAGRAFGKAYQGFFLDIGLPETLEQAQTDVPAWRRKPALLLDRDGVINVDHGYVHLPENFEWVPGARESIKLANDLGCLVLVVTNQAGIARGLYDQAQFQSLMQWANDSLAQTGAHLDAWYHCPHHPVAGVGVLRVECDCRKPAPGMVLQAMADWDFAAANAVLVGDMPHDVKAAEAAGVRGVLFDAATQPLAALVESELGRLTHQRCVLEPLAAT